MDKSYLEKLIDEGLTQQGIADKAGCNRSTVQRHLKKYGLKTKTPKSPTLDPINENRLTELVGQGLTQREIAEVLDRSQGSVKHWLNKYGLKTAVLGTRNNPKPYLCPCGETDPNKFYGRIKGKCKACMNLEDLKRVRGYKEQAVREFGGKCVRCGYDECIAALEFHHLDPSEKDPDFKKMRNWSFERNKAEFEKCELICANCHRKLHYEEL